MIIIRKDEDNQKINIVRGTSISIINNVCQLTELNKTINKNGTYTYTPSENVDGYDKVTIDVDVPQKTFTTETKDITINENGTTVVVPSTGYDGLESVSITTNVPSSQYDYSGLGYTSTDTYKIDQKILDGIAYGEKIKAEYADDKIFAEDGRLVFFPMVDTSNRTSFRQMFYQSGGLRYVPAITISNKCTDLYDMFDSCGALENFDITNWDTSNVTNMSNMFYDCYSLINVDLTKLDVSKVTSMSNLFSGCKTLETINLSGWNVKNVTNMGQIFSRCFKLKNINVSGWDFSNFTVFPSFWTYADELVSLNFTDCNFSTFTSFERFLSGKSKLEEIIGIENWNTSNITNMSSCFYYCRSLVSLNLSGWDLSKCTNFSSAFGYCTSLTNFQAPKNINASISLTESTLLTVDSLLSVLNNLTDRTNTTSMTCSLGSANLNKLTDEQKAIATNKNWVLQ